MAGTVQHNLEGQLAVWRHYLLDAPAPCFPSRPDSTSQPLPSTLLRRRIAIPRRHSSSTSTTTVLRLAWALVNVHYTDCNDIVFGMAVSESDGDEDAVTCAALPARFRIDSA